MQTQLTLLMSLYFRLFGFFKNQNKNYNFFLYINKNINIKKLNGIIFYIFIN